MHIDKVNYNVARYKVRKIIFNKKRWFSEQKLNKISSCEVSALKINNTVEHDANSILEGFKNYYSTLAENLVNMLPKASNKYSIDTFIKYYEHDPRFSF